MAVQCGTCGGSGWVSEPMEYEETDSSGKTVRKRGTKSVTCRTCGGKGYVG